jgi:HAD superfamily hydrolase (TIGR01509 family)
MKLKAVLFDMDGVITDTDQLHYLVWKDIMKEEGIDLSEELYLKHLQSRAHEEAIVSLLGDKSEEEIARLSKEKNKRSKARLKERIKTYQDAIDLIVYLNQKGFIVGVVSASSNASFVIHEIKMDSYFDLIVSGTKGTKLKNKPHPDIYLYAMEKLHLSPSTTLIIEDSISGITAGLRSGAQVLGINRGNLYIEEQEHLKITDDLHTLMDWLDQEKEQG